MPNQKSKIKNQKSNIFLSLLVLAILATWLVRDHVFFWDTVQLGSKQAHFYFENGFSGLLLPKAIDSGHPPVFGMYLAACWMIFGKSLLVSHLAMLPFLLGLVVVLYKIGEELAGRHNAGYLLLLGVADPTLAAQSVLISPDLVLAFFFLLGVWAILRHHRIWLVIAGIGMAMISMRGMMVAAGLYLFDLLLLYFWTDKALSFRKAAIRSLIPFLPGALFALAFLGYHYQETGWIGHHPASPWSPSFERADWADLIKNAAILVWRLLDFGRIFVWMVIGISAYGYYYRVKNKEAKPEREQIASDGNQGAAAYPPGDRQKNIKATVLLLLILLPILSYTFLSYRGLQAHRYLLPIFLSGSLLCYTLVFSIFQGRRLKYGLFAIAVAGLLSGNLWIYPDKVAQGWDSTLAHLPYYSIRDQILIFIEEKDIPLDDIGTAFPEIGPLKYKDLSDQETGMVEKDLDQLNYILFSNVMNDFSDQEIDRLRRDWKVLKELELRGVRMVLYEKGEE